MTDITGIAAPLAAALSAKGYDALTPVQEAMLTPDVDGRDVLVSAQTGSGKTVAFGLAIAPTILAGADRLLFADVPVALVVAPTRELALQVRREFEWLYAETGAQIASCVGGMDYRTEKRALERGAHIVVGTPGRLRDHIERGSLDLSGLRAVVLDEADEMLDLGFREDLEFILSAAPEERRTLMFSATVPKAIAELAKDFQKDALRIQTAGEAKQHIDIEYRALNVQARDKEHAIFNLLRFYEAQTAIIFVKTRAAVNHLLARMGNRGFQVVALSGELSQQERTHALQALRDGRARVCIATDVAARGIDLPGLELVIHADLPSNSETLLHRSGRTGRAGNKGVSALIVTPADYKKAQRLLQGARLTAEWGAAPSAEEVSDRDNARILEHPALAEPVAEDDAAMVSALLTQFGPDRVAAAFLRLWRDGRSAPEVLSEATPPAERPAKPRGEFGASVWYAVSVGHTGRAEARWLLPKICDAGGITKDAIGAIRVQTDETFVQIAAAQAGNFGAGADLEPGVTMRRLDGEPTLDRPERSPRPAREDGPRKPYAKREEGERKPYVKREDGERKPYAKREVGDRKPYAKREDGDRKPYAKREDGDRKPYPKREDGDRKPYAKREDGDRKTHAKREDDGAPRKPRSAGFKSHGGGTADKPARSAGYKSHAADGAAKPFARSKGPEAKPMRPATGKGTGKPGKPFARTPRPASPASDARDTSKRFVPPKKKG